MMLDALVKRSGLEAMFDAVLSADAVRAFKTHPDVYQYALDSLDLPASAIAFQSSNAWDAHGASDFGMRVVWCNRYGQRRERLPGSARLRDPDAGRTASALGLRTRLIEPAGALCQPSLCNLPRERQRRLNDNKRCLNVSKSACVY